MTRRIALLSLLLLLTLTGFAHDSQLRPFRSGSFQELVAARAGRPFLLILWSITCAPCRQEFAMLRELRKSHPELPLVLVATDDIADQAKAAELLSKYGMEHEESWIFDDGNPQKLRYEIDPSWYGEMPRSYFYDASQKRTAVSGTLERAKVEAWLAQERRHERPSQSCQFNCCARPGCPTAAMVASDDGDWGGRYHMAWFTTS